MRKRMLSARARGARSCLRTMRAAGFLALLAGFLFAHSLLAETAYADGATMEMNRASSLTICYRESDDGNEAVAGAEFTLMRAAVPEIVTKSYTVELSYRAVYTSGGKAVYLDPSAAAGEIEQMLLDYYASGGGSEGCQKKAHTDANGRAYVSGLPPGLYLARETRAAKEHLSTSSFLVAVPFSKEVIADGRKSTMWCYDAYAEPKPLPCGDLVIAKFVRGSDGDTKKQFHFVLRLNAAGSFHCRKSNGAESSVKDGSVITLRSGQSAVIDTIPVGTAYQVKEKEANKAGYRTSASGTSGRIVRTKQCRASFINTKQKAAATKKPTPSPAGSTPAAPGRAGSTARTSPVRTGDSNALAGWAFVLVCSLLAVMLNIRSIPGRRKRQGR